VLLPRILGEHHDRSGNQDQKEAADGETEDDSDHDNRDQHKKLPRLFCHAATVLPCASPVFPRRPGAARGLRCDRVALQAADALINTGVFHLSPKRRRPEGMGLARSAVANSQRSANGARLCAKRIPGRRFGARLARAGCGG
jgi:hypothetical protein